jgi:hypothetical protein
MPGERAYLAGRQGPGAGTPPLLRASVTERFGFKFTFFVCRQPLPLEIIMTNLALADYPALKHTPL